LFNIVGNSWKTYESIKFGIAESSIDDRLSSYRTSNPFVELWYCIFIKNAKEIEDVIKRIYKEKLLSGNHEIILNKDVTFDEIIQSIENYISLFKIEVIKLDDEELEQYNKHNDLL